MSTIRTVNRSQRAEYVDGSAKKGFYTFAVQGVERTNKVHLAYFSFEGTGTSRDEAIKNAWQAAREWVGEVGETVKTESEYKSEVL